MPHWFVETTIPSPPSPNVTSLQESDKDRQEVHRTEWGWGESTQEMRAEDQRRLGKVTLSSPHTNHHPSLRDRDLPPQLFSPTRKENFKKAHSDLKTAQVWLLLPAAGRSDQQPPLPASRGDPPLPAFLPVLPSSASSLSSAGFHVLNMQGLSFCQPNRIPGSVKFWLGINNATVACSSLKIVD